MLQYLQEAVIENEQMYMENCISTMDDCILAYETADNTLEYDVINESFKDAFNNLMQKIIKLFKEAVAKIKSIFVKEKELTFKQKVMNFPEVAKKKIKIRDHKKLRKLYNDCNKKLEKFMDSNKVIEYFKVHSKEIIAATAAASTVAISVGAYEIYKKKSSDESAEEVNKTGKNVISLFSKVFSKNKTSNNPVGDSVNEDQAKISGVAAAKATLASLFASASSKVSKINDSIVNKAFSVFKSSSKKAKKSPNSTKIDDIEIIDTDSISESVYDQFSYDYDELDLYDESYDDSDEYSYY